MSEGVFNALSEPEDNDGGVSEVKNNGHEIAKEEAWTVSTKTRRLAPAFTRYDMGLDPVRELLTLHCAARHGKNDALLLVKVVSKVVAVEVQEQHHRGVTRACCRR